ncbi:hypothetical protein LCGC14_0527570 [marine sediment metagenome]|uniref:Uncharacterized protein n=1 Tax=marine sediment metagenome TaxID=412755 RepID=A0A0F9UI28_9ZZZZ
MDNETANRIMNPPGELSPEAVKRLQVKIGGNKRKEELKKVFSGFHSLTIQYRDKDETIFYQHGCLVSKQVKSAMKRYIAIIINGKTIWLDSWELLDDDHNIWDSTGEKVKVIEQLKIRDNKTNTVKVIDRRQKFVSYNSLYGGS